MYALLVSDEAEETAILTLALQRAGLAVTTASDLQQALSHWEDRPADLIMLAVRRPNWIDQVRMVRATTEVGLVVITDPVEEATHCALLEQGADMVVQRPYSARLLIANIRALLRRTGGVPIFSLPSLSLGDLRLDPASRSVQVAGKPPRRLTHLEFRLLYTLMIHRGQILPVEAIVERVWGYSGRGDRELVRGLVSRLRAKVEDDPQRPQYILTVPGIGYVFQGEPSVTPNSGPLAP